MSIGMIALLIVSLLILLGVLQRVLDRMALTDRQALACVAAILIGGWLPDISCGLVTVNIGGALVPVTVCVYLLLNAGTAKERFRAIAASVLTAAAITALGFFFPSDPVAMPLDPMLLYGAFGGVIAWLLGRSRRSAFIAGVLGVLLADLFAGFSVWLKGIRQTVHLGGAGALDAIVLSGIISVALCELAGEIMERIRTGKSGAQHKGNAANGGQHA